MGINDPYKVSNLYYFFRHGYCSEFPCNGCADEDVEEAVERDRAQKHDCISNTNSLPKRKPAQFKAGDKVLIRQYPKGRKFDPTYSSVAEVVDVEKRGVTVGEQDGSLKRRHKDDVKPYHSSNHSSASNEEMEEEARREEEAFIISNSDDEEPTPLVADEDNEGVPSGDLEPPAPSARPQRNRQPPAHLKDYVVRLVGRWKGGE